MIDSLVRIRCVIAGAVCLLCVNGTLSAQAIIRRGGVFVIPPARAGASTAGSKTPGLHLPQGRSVGLTHHMTDGGGNLWDIQRTGGIGRGSNYAYGGGMYCQVNGSNTYSQGNARLNKAGDEIEINSQTRNNLRISRRIKVYKDRSLARWLDIFENTTDQEITVNVAIYSNMNYMLDRCITNTGSKTFGAKDWAFATPIAAGMGGGRMPLLHMVCSPRGALRPTVNIQGNQLYVRWRLTVPAGGTSILCYFESQGNSIDTCKKLMKSFRISKVTRDLSPAVRRLIVNWEIGVFAGVELDRNESSDTIIVAGGGPKYGKITNKTFQVQTRFGPLTLVAQQVVGMAAMKGQAGMVRFVLTDGQIVSAGVPSGTIDLTLPTGGQMHVPYNRIGQWSFRISAKRPGEGSFQGPYVVLRSGDRFIFDPAKVELAFRTRNGMAALDSEAVFRIAMDNESNGVHQVFFVNESHVCGFLEPETVRFKLKLPLPLEISRNMITEILFAKEPKPATDLTKAVLSNGDELLGKLVEEKIKVESEFATVSIKPANIKKILFSAAGGNLAALELWDGTKMSGRIIGKDLAFQIAPGPVMRINPSQIVSITCPHALPPDALALRVRKLIARLGAESYTDRQAATDGLIKMCKGNRAAAIGTILRKHLTDTDPEVRQRIEQILEKTGASGSTSASVHGGPMMDFK